MDTFKTVVVFRKYKDDGAILALFPAEPYNHNQCMSYQHVGQHGGADYGHCISATIPASESEYGLLKRELEQIGYNLLIKKKFVRK